MRLCLGESGPCAVDGRDQIVNCPSCRQPREFHRRRHLACGTPSQFVHLGVSLAAPLSERATVPLLGQHATPVDALPGAGGAGRVRRDALCRDRQNARNGDSDRGGRTKRRHRVACGPRRGETGCGANRRGRIRFHVGNGSTGWTAFRSEIHRSGELRDGGRHSGDHCDGGLLFSGTAGRAARSCSGFAGTVTTDSTFSYGRLYDQPVVRHALRLFVS